MTVATECNHMKNTTNSPSDTNPFSAGLGDTTIIKASIERYDPE